MRSIHVVRGGQLTGIQLTACATLVSHAGHRSQGHRGYHLDESMGADYSFVMSSECDLPFRSKAVAVLTSALLIALTGCAAGDLTRRDDYVLAPKTWSPEARQHAAKTEMKRALMPTRKPPSEPMSRELQESYENRKRQKEFEQDLVQSLEKSKTDDSK